MTSVPLVELYERLRDLPWESISLDGGIGAFPARLVGRMATRKVTIAADDDPRAARRCWIVEVEALGSGTNRPGAEFHLFEGDRPLVDYLQRLSEGAA